MPGRLLSGTPMRCALRMAVAVTKPVACAGVAAPFARGRGSSSSFRIECQPATPFSRAIWARSLAVYDRSVVAVIGRRESLQACTWLPRPWTARSERLSTDTRAGTRATIPARAAYSIVEGRAAVLAGSTLRGARLFVSRAASGVGGLDGVIARAGLQRVAPGQQTCAAVAFLTNHITKKSGILQVFAADYCESQTLCLEAT